MASDNIELKDILISARQESHQMQHFYIGVEHLFIALLEVRGGLARGLVEEQGLTPEYVIDAVRRKIGKGSKRRIWSGTPSTPRANVVLSVANELAIEDNRLDINERDLFIAIIEEAESMPMRVLRSLGVDMRSLTQSAAKRVLTRSSTSPFLQIENGVNFTDSHLLNEEHRLILRRMFSSYARARIEYRLMGGYTKATLLVVTPINADETENAAVVVKMDQKDEILDEAQRYDQHVKGTLPPLTARLEERPVAPDICSSAGLQYTLVTKPGKTPQDLRTAAIEMGGEYLAEWLKQQLFVQFGENWWQQRRPFRFLVWTEYDWMLPPVLTLQYAPDTATQTSNAHTLRVPINRAKLNQIEYGDMVILENFTVTKIYADRGALQLAHGRGSDTTRRAYKIEVTGIDLKETLHYRGEVIDSLAGRVWKTRNDALMNAASQLEAPFDIHGETIVIGSARSAKLPNPITAYDELLYQHINGSTSKIHGDLHLGNILMGPSDVPFLVDFAHSRDGHTLFDWATLEISLLCEMVMKHLGDDWDSAYKVLRCVDALNARMPLPNMDEAITQVFKPVVAVREIVSELLTTPNRWDEYTIPLALSALRAVTWETKTMGARRLAFLVAALMMAELERTASGQDVGDSLTQEPDATDYQ